MILKKISKNILIPSVPESFIRSLNNRNTSFSISTQPLTPSWILKIIFPHLRPHLPKLSLPTLNPNNSLMHPKPRITLTLTHPYSLLWALHVHPPWPIILIYHASLTLSWMSVSKMQSIHLPQIFMFLMVKYPLAFMLPSDRNMDNASYKLSPTLTLTRSMFIWFTPFKYSVYSLF